MNMDRATISLLETLLDSVGMAIVVAESSGRVRFVNTSAKSIFDMEVGMTVAPELWSGHYGFFLPDGSGLFSAEQSPIVRALAGEIEDNLELRVAPHVGKHHGLWCSVNLRPMIESSGEVSGAVLLLQDITERKRLEAEAQSTNRELQQFAYVAAHDLQEPLRSISGFADMLADSLGDNLSDNSRRSLGKIKAGVVRMKAMIGDLLILSKVNTAPIKLAPIHVKDAVQNALLNLDASLKEAQASVVVEALPSILADSTHMTQLFQNLIGNAVKFRSEDDKPVIKVSARRQNLHWLFSVADNGIGISPEYAGRIFLAFQRLHTQSAYSGTGIGLAVCERIVQRHGGKIWVEPGSEGGSVFYFTVPYVHSENSK